MTRQSHRAPTVTTGKGNHGTHPDRDPLRQMLRTVLLDRMRAGRDTTGRIDTLECRAVLTLYSLLTEHPVDQLGSLVAGMITGADDIDGMNLLRHGAVPASFGGIRPRRWGRFCGPTTLKR